VLQRSHQTIVVQISNGPFGMQTIVKSVQYTIWIASAPFVNECDTLADSSADILG